MEGSWDPKKRVRFKVVSDTVTTDHLKTKKDITKNSKKHFSFKEVTKEFTTESEIDYTNNKECLKKGLTLFYTNSDQLINKRDQLLMYIANDPPDIMVIMEVIPKSQIHPINPALLDIEVYNLHKNFDVVQGGI